jgi:hypothetical protein
MGHGESMIVERSHGFVLLMMFFFAGMWFNSENAKIVIAGTNWLHLVVIFTE